MRSPAQQLRDGVAAAVMGIELIAGNLLECRTTIDPSQLSARTARTRSTACRTAGVERVRMRRQPEAKVRSMIMIGGTRVMGPTIKNQREYPVQLSLSWGDLIALMPSL